MLLFGAVLAAISVSAIATNRQIERANEQSIIADTIAQGASELSYLASEYLIHQEAPQLERWQSRFASFLRDIARLETEDPRQRALVNNLQADTERLRSVFDGVAAAVASASQDPDGIIDPVLLEVSWSRMAIQSQALILDALRVSELWGSRVRELQRANAIVVIALVGVLGAYFLANYLLVQRRMLASIARLQAGTALIGSGHLDLSLDVRDNDEIGDLYRAFNKMAADLRAATEEVLEERRRYQELFDSAPDGYVVSDGDGTIHEANAAMGRLLRLDARDLVRRRVESFVAPSDIPAFGDHLALLASGGDTTAVRWEMRLRPSGSEPAIHVSVSATATYSTAGEVQGLRWLVRDVTREKQMHAALVHAGKLSMAGRLVASLAHEMNNPLAAALGCAELAIEFFEGGRDPSEHLHVLQDALGRISRVVAQLREIHGEPRSEERQPADLNALVENVLLLARKRADAAGVEMTWHPAEDMPRPVLMIDSIQQVFLNLVLNAIEAMEGHGHLEVHLRHSSHPARVGVAFADDGPGIHPRALEALFEPFNTTKARGAGLGLFISQNIVQQHGGSIEVETVAGKGTTCTVWLPLSMGP
jgi:PAS domain S-box-containing protein